MSNRELFKETFEQIELSSNCIDEITNTKVTRTKRNVIKYATAVAATMAVIVLSGNVISYAMTGNNIVEEVVSRYKKLTQEEVRVNDDELSNQVVDTYMGEDGLYHYEFTDGSSVGIRIDDPEHSAVFSMKQQREEGASYSTIVFVGELKERDGRIILDVVEPIDITEDFADGVATGSFVYKWNVASLYYEATFAYRVEGTLGNYTFDAWWGEE